MSQQQQQQQHSHHEGNPAFAQVAAKFVAKLAPTATPNPAPPTRKSSREQVRANRRNAKRSTGPRTELGKRVAARNAVSHGVFSKDAVLPGERKAEYIAFRNLLFNSGGMMPQDWLEFSIAEQYVLAKWRIRRMQTVELLVHHDVATLAAEAQVLEAEALEKIAARSRDDDDDEDDDGNFYEDEDDNDKDDDDDDDDDDDGGDGSSVRQEAEFRAKMLAVAARQDVPIHATMAAALTFATHQRGEGAGEGVDAFERIGRTIYRLELSDSRAMRELRQLRKEKGFDVTTLTDCPFIEPIPVDDDEGEKPTPEEQRANREERERLSDTLRNIAALLAHLRRPAAEREADEDDDDEDDGDDGDGVDEEAHRAADEDDAHDRTGSAGVVTSDFGELSRVVKISSPTQPQDAPTAPLQNEPNSAETGAGDGADEGCAEGSRRIEIVEPTQIAGHDAGSASRDGKEDADRT